MVDKQPTQKQIKELWKACGLELVTMPKNFYNDQGSYWQHKGVCVKYGQYLDADLNNLIRYVMPKLLEKYDIKMFSFHDDLNDNKVFWFIHVIGRNTGEVEFANIEGYERLEDAILEVAWEMIG